MSWEKWGGKEATVAEPMSPGTRLDALYRWFHLIFTMTLEEMYSYHVFPDEKMNFDVIPQFP